MCTIMYLHMRRPTRASAGDGHEESRPGESRTGPSAVCGGLVDVLQRRDHEVVRQLHAGRVVRAIAARVLVEVLLVVILGVVERVARGVDDLGRDRAVALG